MRGHADLGSREDQSALRIGRVLQRCALLSVLVAAPIVLNGCAGLTSASNANTTPTQPATSTLSIANVQATGPTTTTSQIVWTTNVAANSQVDYGTTLSYGASTPVDPTMVTNHQVTLSGLAPGTTYYYQVNSTDSKSNNGHSGGHGLKTAGFGISGAISPGATAGNGATLALSGTTSLTTTADGAGNYTFSGLPDGTYTVAPSHPGYTFTPSSQSATVNGANVSGMNFTATAATAAPAITAQPANQTVTAGQTASFTVVATGTAPLSYQWQRSGVNIAGAVGASYITPATTMSDNGATFTVVVSNTAGNVTSAAATLTVNSATVAPTITAQPVSQTVTAGQTASFAVVATGTAPLSYQWQKNGVNIAGATSASYTTPATTTSDNGASFRALVSNTTGNVTSAGATLTVNAAVVAPTITAQPANQTVTAGQTATFSVTAGGTAPLSYQWQKSGVNIAGAISASYTTPATTTSDNGASFRVVVSNTAGNVTSAAATLTVNAAVVAPTITAQPTNQTVTAGQTATFSVTAGGSAPLSYQWQKNGVNIAGAISASYTTPVTTTSDNGASFRVVVSNTAGNVTSAAATLTVNAAVVAPTITAQPANQTVTAGQTATFSVTAGGTAPLSYQWQKNGVNIAGAISASYTTPATTISDNGATFAVTVSNTAGNVTSAAATLTVNAAVVPPTITAQPTNQTVTAGQTATFSVTAGGTAPLSYQWQKNGANIAGATSASYTTPVTTTSDNGASFRVVVSNTAGNVTSAAATLTVTSAAVAPTITAQPPNQTVAAGQSASFVVVATGTAPLSYQWQRNGANIAGAVAASYITPATTMSDNGETFAVTVSNTAGTVTSAAATLTVNAVAPTITAQPVNQTVIVGQTATFSVSASGTAPLIYQWQKGGVNIAGATSPSYTTPVTTTADNGSTFAVVVSNTAGAVTSAAATLTVNAVAPTITAQPVSQTVTAGQTATFSVTAGGTGPLSYQWQKSGVNIVGATLASYTTPVTTTADTGSTFAVVVSNTAGSVTSAAATLTVNAAPAPAIQVPASMNLGNVVVGTTNTQPLIIKNTGTATLTISQVTASGTGYSVSGFSLPLNVGVGQQTTITVALQPTGAGAVPGNISIVSNAPTSPTSVGLSAMGIAATFTLGINPTSLAFGNVTTGTSSAAQNIVITDTGNSNVAISQINLSGAGYSMTGGSAPVTLSPSQSVTLSVQFGPNTSGPVTGNISIVSNATGSPAGVTLTGTGVVPVQHSVALTWNGSTTSNVTGYNVYRSTVNGGAYARITSLGGVLSYTDSTVQNGTTYYYVTTAVDSQGTESVFSNQVTAVIP
jgi:hypothetical protein